GPEVLRWEEIEPPMPAAGEVRVRHKAIGVNYVDVYYRTGWYTPPAYPFVPGMEAAGVVDVLGPGVRELAIGDLVAYATRPLGAYAEARNIAVDRVLKLPEWIDEQLAAAILLKGV